MSVRSKFSFSFLLLIFALTTVTLSSNASAAVFWKAGTVKRILTDSVRYGGCMVYMDSTLGNDCPSAWVSLDCNGQIYDKEAGQRHLANVMAAAHANKKIQLYINNTKKLNGYCVAYRVDTIF